MSDLVPGTNGERNSKAGGFPAMYRSRAIPLLGPKSAFRAGEQILIRFRLFADQLSYGWGWAIDNLRIQAPPASPVLGIDPAKDILVNLYPNPVNTGLVRITADLPKPLAEVAVTVSQPTGQVVRQFTLKVGGTHLSEQLDLSQLPAGLYFLQLKADALILTRKVIIVK